MDVLCEEDAPLFLRVLEGLRLLEDDTPRRRRLARQRPGELLGKLRLVWRGKNYYASGAAEKEIGAGADAGRHSDGRHRIRLLVPARGVMNPGTGRQTPSHRPLAHRDRIRARATASMRFITATRSTPRSRRPCRALGWLDEWLDATARNRQGRRFVSAPAFRFWTRSVSSCRRARVWPPASPALSAARVRWKSARFVPLGSCSRFWPGSRSMKISGGRWRQRLPGAGGQAGSVPHRVRSSAAVDRLTGASRAALHGVHRIPAAVRVCGPSCRSRTKRRRRAGPSR